MRLEKKVSFRLSKKDAESLEEESRRLGLSQHEYARFLVRRHISRSESQELKDQVLRIRAELGFLRHEVQRWMSKA